MSYLTNPDYPILMDVSMPRSKLHNDNIAYRILLLNGNV